MTVKDISVSSEFKIFLTSVVFHYEGEIVPNSSANSPTDFAETESYFNLDGEPARVGSPPGAPQ